MLGDGDAPAPRIALAVVMATAGPPSGELAQEALAW
jgi:hypothetical protein